MCFEETAADDVTGRAWRLLPGVVEGGGIEDDEGHLQPLGEILARLIQRLRDPGEHEVDGAGDQGEDQRQGAEDGGGGSHATRLRS